ncbi:MAG: ExbD/TolR family protein [Gemmatimonadota bacterium]
MKFRRAQDEDPELNLIPLIDVMLVVLIFLAVSTTYSRFAELHIELPKADAKATQNRPDEIIVGVTADGRYALGKSILPKSDVDTLAEALRQAAQGRTDLLVVIHADAQTPHQSVINVLEAARIVHLSRISFVTERQSAAAQ